jgi:hypothetical protein
MKQQTTYKALDIEVNDTSQAPKGADLYYRCKGCGSVLSSYPRDSCACECRNIVIDKDYHRLAIRQYDLFEVVRRVPKVD